MYRSLLYVPAHSERFVSKAHERGADALILDLEDAVPEADKDAARERLADSVPRVRQRGAAALVRMNAGPRAQEDALAAARVGADGIVVPKANVAALTSLAAVGLPLIATLEDPAAILDARECARVGAVVGLIVGGEDLTTALNAQPTPEVLRMPKLLVHFAAKAEGKLSFGMLRSVADYANLDGIRQAAREARMHGFDGAACIHPSAVPILNEAFSPSMDDVEWARRIVEAAATNTGAFVVDGRMVDRPVIDRAQRILTQFAAHPAS